MSERAQTVRVVATNPAEQGPFVVIDESDFDDSVHTLYVEPIQEPAPEPRKPKKGGGYA